MSSKIRLYYVYDPMCSWCWGYKPTWHKIEQALQDEIEITYLLGGLAPDTDQPMPLEMQQQIASYWKKIAAYLGTEFNHDFWHKNTARRATYPACRAIVAARSFDQEKAMLAAIQHAYYLDAKNPSDDDILIGLAEQIGLNRQEFSVKLLSQSTQQALLDEIAFARSIGGNSFPSLFIETEQGIVELPVDYQDSEKTIGQIRQIIAGC